MRHPGAGCEAIEKYQEFLRAKIHVNRHIDYTGHRKVEMAVKIQSGGVDRSQIWGRHSGAGEECEAVVSMLPIPACAM